MQKIMTEKERMLSEKLYIPMDEALAADCARSRRLVRLINGTTEEQAEYRVQLFKELFGRTGENLWVEPPFHCDYGCHISVGENFYANFDCIILDVCDVTIGDNVFLAPRVCIYTAGHPIDAGVRHRQLKYGKKAVIGNDVCVGGNHQGPSQRRIPGTGRSLKENIEGTEESKDMEQEGQKHQRRVRYKGTHPKRYEEKYKELQPEKYPETVAKVIQKGSTPVGMHIPIMVNEILEFLRYSRARLAWTPPWDTGAIPAGCWSAWSQRAISMPWMWIPSRWKRPGSGLNIWAMGRRYSPSGN